MHVDEVAAAGAFVQVVDVLGDQRHLAGPAGLELRQREMGRIRGNIPRQQALPAGIVEGLNTTRAQIPSRSRKV
jgi:hypothetical protein